MIKQNPNDVSATQALPIFELHHFVTFSSDNDVPSMLDIKPLPVCLPNNPQLKKTSTALQDRGYCR